MNGNAGKNSVELISSYNDHKVVRITRALDTYVECVAVNGSKGFKVNAFKAKFGFDLQRYGVATDWRVIKLGDKDVSNMFTAVIKDAIAKQWDGKSMEITFGKPLTM